MKNEQIIESSSDITVGDIKRGAPIAPTITSTKEQSQIFRNIVIAGREYSLNVECLPEMNADREIIWKDPEKGTAVHHNTVTSITAKKNVIPVDDFMLIMSQIREVESKSIIQVVQIDLQ